MNNCSSIFIVNNAQITVVPILLNVPNKHFTTVVTFMARNM